MGDYIYRDCKLNCKYVEIHWLQLKWCLRKTKPVLWRHAAETDYAGEEEGKVSEILIHDAPKVW